MIRQVLNSLPDDRPIRAICVVEYVGGCPKGFNVISKTHDADSDADLWKEKSFFSGKITRYLCISKVEYGANCIVVEDVAIINEKELPPEGYSLIARTTDSEQKAWRKKQLCYKVGREDSTRNYITDLILLSRTKRAPDGFVLLGELNGLILCYKRFSTMKSEYSYCLSQINNFLLEDNEVQSSGGMNNNNSLSGSAPFLYQNLNGKSDTNHNYANVYSKDCPPPIPAKSTAGPTSAYQALQGVPFILNPRLQATSKLMLESIPISKIKTREEIENEYCLDFLKSYINKL